MKNHPLIEINNITAVYGTKKALQNVSFNVLENDFLGIIGPNGGGKTTLLSIILGMRKPDEGSVTFYHGGQITEETRIGYLPQYNVLDRNFPISVREVIMSGLNKERRMLHRFTNEQRAQTENIMSYLGISDLSERPVGELSGGQLQRVLLARAIVSRPDLLILDEPTTYIDLKNQRIMFDVLHDLNSHCSIIITSHDIRSIVGQVKNLAYINSTLIYNPSEKITEEWIDGNF